jgi:pimeloyl-ACP methyl ester carboxylesterase
VIHPATGRALASRIPNARLELLEGIGHVPMMEVPKVTAALVDRFVASLA